MQPQAEADSTDFLDNLLFDIKSPVVFPNRNDLQSKDFTFAFEKGQIIQSNKVESIHKSATENDFKGNHFEIQEDKV